MAKSKSCPCGSGKDYAVCCEPIISGSAPAQTAEALMRARYSAYVKHEISFILDTCDRKNRDQDIDEEATREWSEKSEWLGLKIVSVEKGGAADTDGIVEFVASYNSDGMHEDHHEVAHFKKTNDRWLYTTGRLVPTTIVRATPKVGRNDPCPCGSGKKFKQCCGK